MPLSMMLFDFICIYLCHLPQPYANLSMGDLQDSLPEPEAMKDDALSRFHIQWEAQLQEKAAMEDGTRSEVTCC